MDPPGVRALFSCPLIPVKNIPAVTPQPELSMFQSNTIPGRSSWLQIHSDNECTESTSAKGLLMLLKKKNKPKIIPFPLS